MVPNLSAYTVVSGMLSMHDRRCQMVLSALTTLQGSTFLFMTILQIRGTDSMLITDNLSFSFVGCCLREYILLNSFIDMTLKC